MALIPTKQKIAVDRGETIDEWGNTIPEKTIYYDCRVDEGTYLVEYKASGNVTSKTVTSNIRILLDKIADIRYSDTITYVNELGNEYKGSPKKITIKRNISGKPILTEVFL